MSTSTLRAQPGLGLLGRAASSRRAPEPVGRRRLWRRARARRAVAAALAALAVWAGLSAVVRTRGGGTSVVVAQSDLGAGHRLTPGNVRVVEVEPSLVPSGAVTDAASVAGARLAQAVGSGEILTQTRLRPARSLAGLPAGQRAVHVPVADPGSTSLVRPGDRVDVVALDSGAVVGSDILVLSVDAPEAQASGLAGSTGQRGAGVVVAVPAGQVTRLAPAAARPSGDGIHLLLRPDSTPPSHVPE